MPVIIMATNWMDYPQLKELVMAGLKIGYRAFDTARDYGNESVVGRVLKECLEELGISREEIFITTKIGNGQQRLGNVEDQIDISLRNLQTDYVDCWLMHWPYPGCFVDTYHKMEKVYKAGKVKAIGMANYHVRHFEQFWREGFETHRKVMGSGRQKDDAQIIRWLKDPHSDSAEYKLWGNGVALPCVCFVLAGIVYYAQTEG